MSATGAPPGAEDGAPARGPGRWRDPRLWLGIAVTGVTLWLAVRGISFRALARDLAGADLLYVAGLSAPVYVATVWLRALRWRHLTAALCDVRRGPVFRATAVGFLANNVLPLRMGEVVRAWMLARATGTGTAPMFGTVVLERILDAVVVVGMAFVVFGVRTGSGASALAVGVPLLVGLAVPVGAVLVLRVAPERSAGWAGSLTRWLGSDRVAGWVERLVRQMAKGLGSLQGGRRLFWVTLHSVLIWLVLGAIPFAVAIQGLDVDLGSPARLWRASFVLLAAVGIAVSVPSAPGFFGPYHLAAREALARFGVPEETALAVGTLAHAVFWLVTTGLGLAVLRFRAARLDELAHAAESNGKAPAEDRR